MDAARLLEELGNSDSHESAYYATWQSKDVVEVSPLGCRYDPLYNLAFMPSDYQGGTESLQEETMAWGVGRAFISCLPFLYPRVRRVIRVEPRNGQLALVVDLPEIGRRYIITGSPLTAVRNLPALEHYSESCSFKKYIQKFFRFHYYFSQWAFQASPEQLCEAMRLKTCPGRRILMIWDAGLQPVQLQ